MSIGKVVVVIGLDVYEAVRSDTSEHHCAGCAFEKSRDPCWIMCDEFFRGCAKFIRLDAMQAHKFLSFLERRSAEKKGGAE